MGQTPRHLENRWSNYELLYVLGHDCRSMAGRHEDDWGFVVAPLRKGWLLETLRCGVAAFFDRVDRNCTMQCMHGCNAYIAGRWPAEPPPASARGGGLPRGHRRVILTGHLQPELTAETVAKEQNPREMKCFTTERAGEGATNKKRVRSIGRHKRANANRRGAEEGTAAAPPRSTARYTIEKGLPTRHL